MVEQGAPLAASLSPVAPQPRRPNPRGPITDPIDLKEKYRVEREKRLRPEGVGQYRNNDEAALQHMYHDAHAGQQQLRPAEPLQRHTRMTIVGAGWAGILLGVRLLEQGITDFIIIDKASDFGGAWYWNQYPGIMLDVESLIYLPLLEETGYEPTEYYTPGSEVLSYAQKVARKYGLYERVLFQTEVTSMDWNEVRKSWVVKTKQGDTINSQFVNIPGGHLHRAKFPGVPGVESFRGKSFHTSRWDYAYTGGDASGGLTKLQDKRVAIIGTGATAVQLVPQLAKYSKQLYVFQRTPSGCDARNNRPMDKAYFKSLEPGWQSKRRLNFHSFMIGTPAKGSVDEVGDGWSWVPRNYPLAGLTNMDDILARLMEGNDAKMNESRARIDSIVADPVTADKLKPWYKWLCKRPCFHDDYLPAFNRPNVELVDTDGAGVDAISATGVVSGGKEYEVDLIVYATGFYVGTDWRSPGSIQVRGRSGAHLADKWRKGHQTLHGFMTHDFPNAMFTQVAQAGASANFTHWVDEVNTHHAYIVAECKRRDIRAIEPSLAAELAYTNEVAESTKASIAFKMDCTPGYSNGEGKAIDEGDYKSEILWGRGEDWFIQLKNWRDKGQLEGMETTTSSIELKVLQQPEKTIEKNSQPTYGGKRKRRRTTAKPDQEDAQPAAESRLDAMKNRHTCAC